MNSFLHQILDDKRIGEDAIRGPLSLDQGNYLGACKLSDASKSQPLEPEGMDGWVQNFWLWSEALERSDLMGYTGCNITMKDLLATAMVTEMTISNPDIVGRDKVIKIY